ncbi:hypothetical protein [Chryseobacterium terrae]|uniref:Uncharacterized protein n=1 Tax=Chryseobacterium terrae TaxID=3163299 RepID=A0ABW8Y6D9_9FLAO
MKKKILNIKDSIEKNKSKLPVGFQYLKIIDINEEEEKTTRVHKTLINKSTRFYIQVSPPHKPLIRIL